VLLVTGNFTTKGNLCTPDCSHEGQYNTFMLTNFDAQVGQKYTLMHSTECPVLEYSTECPVLVYSTFGAYVSIRLFSMYCLFLQSGANVVTPSTPALSWSSGQPPCAVTYCVVVSYIHIVLCSYSLLFLLQSGANVVYSEYAGTELDFGGSPHVLGEGG